MFSTFDGMFIVVSNLHPENAYDLIVFIDYKNEASLIIEHI